MSRWLHFQIVCLVIALLGANGECMARCASVACHAKAPPCHGDKPAPADGCKFSVLVAADATRLTAGAAVPIDIDFVSPSHESSAKLPEIDIKGPRAGASPPHSVEIERSAILRI